MDFPSCLCFGSSSGTCLKTVLFLLVLLSFVTLLSQQQQPLQPAAARLIVEYPDSAAACPVSIETYFAPWSKPINSSKAERLRYFPHTCNLQHYFLHDASGPTVGLEFRWIHIGSSAAVDSSPAHSAAVAATSLSAPVLAVFTLSKNDGASSFSSSRPQPYLMSATTDSSSSIRGSVGDRWINAAEETQILAPYSRRLAAVFLSPSPTLRPRWTVRSSAFEQAAAASRTSTARTPTAAAGIPATAAASTPPAAVGAQYPYRANLVGAKQRRLSRSGDAAATLHRSAAEERSLSSAVAGEASAAVLLSDNPPATQQDAATGEKSELPRADGAAASPESAEAEAAAPRLSVSTNASAAASASTASPATSSTGAPTNGSSSASAVVDSSPTAPSAGSADLSGVPASSSASAEGGPGYNLGAVVLHGGGRGGRTEGAQQKRSRTSLLRWHAIVHAAEAFEKLRQAALRNGNTFARWLLPWPPLPLFVPYISSQRSRGDAGGGGEEKERDTKEGSADDGLKKAALAGMTTYAVNGIAAAAEALEGLPNDDDEFVTAAALFDYDGGQRKKKEKKDPLKEKRRRRRTKRQSSLRLKTYVNVAAASTDQTAPVHMSRLQWSGGKPFPVFGRRNINGGEKTVDYETAKHDGLEKAMKKKGKKKKENVDYQTLEEDLSREDTEKSEPEGRELVLGSDAAAVAAVTRNEADATAPAEKTVEEEVGASGKEEAPAVAGAAIEKEKEDGERAAERRMRIDTGKQLEGHSATNSETETIAAATRAVEAAATAVGRGGREKVAAADSGTDDGSVVSAAVARAAAADAAAKENGVGEETVTDAGEEAVAHEREEAAAAVDEEAVAEAGEQAIEEGEIRFLKTNTGKENAADPTLHVSSSPPPRASLSSAGAPSSGASPAGAGTTGSRVRRLLSESMQRMSNGAATDKQRHQEKLVQERQRDATFSSAVKPGAVSSAWGTEEREGEEDAHTSASNGAPEADEAKPGAGWRSGKWLLSSRENKPVTAAGRTVECGREEGDRWWDVASYFGWMETVDDVAPEVTAEKQRERQRHQGEVKSNRKLRTARGDTESGGTGEAGKGGAGRGGAGTPATEETASGRIAAGATAPRTTGVDEFWLFDRCDDPEAIRRLIVTADVVGVRGVIFTDTVFPANAPDAAAIAAAADDRTSSTVPCAAATPASAAEIAASSGQPQRAAAAGDAAASDLSSQSTPLFVVLRDSTALAAEPAAPTSSASLLTAASGAYTPRQTVESTPSSHRSHFAAAPAAAAAEASFPTDISCPFISSSDAFASMPVFSIPDTQQTRSLKEQLLRKASVRVAVDTLPANLLDCRLL